MTYHGNFYFFYFDHILHAFLNKKKLFYISFKFLDRTLGGNSQNFLSKFVTFLVFLGLKILRFLRLKVVFEADIIKRLCYVNYCNDNKLPISH
jgi:hypothetical protein